MGQNDDTFPNRCIEERIIAMIRTSPHLAELFSEVRVAMQNRASKPAECDEVFLCVECD